MKKEQPTGPKVWGEIFTDHDGVLEWWEIPGIGRFYFRADAERARAAVNSFDALVVACEAALGLCESNGYSRDRVQPQLRAALALARPATT